MVFWSSAVQVKMLSESKPKTTSVEWKSNQLRFRLDMAICRDLCLTQFCLVVVEPGVNLWVHPTVAKQSADGRTLATRTLKLLQLHKACPQPLPLVTKSLTVQQLQKPGQNPSHQTPWFTWASHNRAPMLATRNLTKREPCKAWLQPLAPAFL